MISIRLFSIAALLFSLSAWADEPGLRSVSLPFSMAADTLCFLNSEPELGSTGIPFLSELAREKGVCQGIAGIAAAFKESVVFDPALPEETEDVSDVLKQALQLHRHGEKGSIVVHGYPNLQSYCSAHREAFLKAAVLYNADIAIHEILPVLPGFLIRKRHSLRNERDLGKMNDLLESIRGWLEAGKYPLLLQYSHVVMVTGYYETKVQGGYVVKLVVYDPNVYVPQLRTIQLDEDKFPNYMNSMMWDVTPDR